MGDKEQVIQALRATLLSVKGALTLKQVNRDFKELQGEWIPFKRLGYSTLEKLFVDVPGFKCNQINGEWYVDAIASQETQHIASMVAKQKSSKKVTKFNPSRFPKRQDSWRVPSSSYNTNYNSQYSNQLYRAKSGYSSSYNNNYSKNNYKYVKNNDSKIAPTNYYKPPSKPAAESNGISKTTYHEKEKAPEPKPKPASPPAPVPTAQNVSEKKSPPAAKSQKASISHRLSRLRECSVDVIPLQFPSCSKSPVVQETSEKSGLVTDVTPVHDLEPPPDSSTPVARLEWTCRKLGLPAPVYKMLDHKPKGSAVQYDCSIKVGLTYSASSYPISAPTQELARERAAVKLLAHIESLQADGLATSAPAAAAAGLVALVADHEAGLWATTVPHLYREKYQENLPTNWQELVENCPRIVTDRVVNGLMVLLPKKEETASFQQLETISVSSSEDSVDNDLPPLQFPDENFWNVYVTVANSTLEIWVRIIGKEYSDAYQALLTDMGNYYDHNGIPVEKSMIMCNCWYAVYLEDGGWQRAKVLEVEDDCVNVFLGDHGDEEAVTLGNIKVLEPQFRGLPAQAVLCRLEGVEELASSPAAAELVRQRLIGEVLVAAPGERHDPSDPAVSIVLYDTNTSRDLNLNRDLVHDFCTAHVFTVTQKPVEVEVTLVTDEGRVWLTSVAGAALVRTAMALVTQGAYRRPMPPTPRVLAPPAADLAAAPLYIARTLSGDWVRCVVISGLDAEGTVRMQLVDSGLVMRAPLASLLPLRTFSPVLDKLPPQALVARLGGPACEQAAAAMVERVRDLAAGKRALARALPPAPHAPLSAADPAPSLELFVRSGPSEILASLNNAILMEYRMREFEDEEPKSTDIVEELHRRKERIFRSAAPGAGGGGGGGGAGAEGRDAAPLTPSSASPLPPPALPEIDKCIDVYVAMAANPWNFVVQYNTTRPRLQALMAALQIECPKIPESKAPKNPANGELYTVYYDKDASWYRVTIAGTVRRDTVSVYFCDYGDLALFPNAALRPVPDAVPDARSLPPQAIKARLYDVWPLNQDWSVEDVIRFQELCVEQQFVAICKEKGRDPLNPTEPLLTLELIDTSTSEDVYVKNQLVLEERARTSKH